ncbi:hypothetical protein AC629_14415 [Bradyrhizobium sp. NAS80.1]|uniref:outer membrane protein n=1 Tax=Bradyrhizobium sp. NAS80.1 TaxID=1680159 RepID=UPI00095B67B9|nr:hypothetical protein [Bradyrhizobium sp. NAS80.1]OKO87412.1 hypothetical protein AC629_14415 [Bradyrhizobium sp. NAS80.1]
MLGGNWSAKAEYLYIDAGDASVSGADFNKGTAIFDNRFHVYRVGVNYRPVPSAQRAVHPHSLQG